MATITVRVYSRDGDVLREFEYIDPTFGDLEYLSRRALSETPGGARADAVTEQGEYLLQIDAAGETGIGYLIEETPPAPEPLCPACNGRGWFYENRPAPLDDAIRIDPCPACCGTGLHIALVVPER